MSQGDIVQRARIAARFLAREGVFCRKNIMISSIP